MTCIFLEFLSCSLDVYFHQCVSAILHRTKLGAFWLLAGGGLPRSALNGRRGWGAYRDIQELSRDSIEHLPWWPVPYLQLNPEHSTSTVLLDNLDIFALHSRCKHWTHVHHALVHWTCTHCKHIKPPHTLLHWANLANGFPSFFRFLTGKRFIFHQCNAGSAEAEIKRVA